MKYHIRLISVICLIIGVSCNRNSRTSEVSLQDELYEFIDSVPGTVGVAFVSDRDTVTVNNGMHFPMMSVFKMHEALAVANTLERSGISLDTILSINRVDLDLDTWSPMLKEYTAKSFTIPVGRLMEYAVTKSDNNASNLLFRHIVSPTETDAYIRSIATDTTFCISYSESEMKANHALSYCNYTSPLSAALLIKQVMEEPIVGKNYQDSIRQYLSTVTTGQDRLGSVVDGSDVVLFAHKTGSGFRNEAGELMAHNDVGYFRLRDGRSYALAVLIRDFAGTEAEASAIIADISRRVYHYCKK
jgi:beta-lactamase class A